MEVRLRARSLRDVLLDAALVYRHNFVDVLAIAAIAGTALAFIGTALGAIFNRAFSSVFDYFGQTAIGAVKPITVTVGSQEFLAVALFGLAFFVISSVMTGALAYAVSERFAGRRISVSRAYAASLGPFLSTLALALLFSVTVGFLSVTVVGLPLAAYLAVQLLFTCEAVAVEKHGFFSALARSARLVQGNGWRVLGIMLAVCLVGLAVSLLLLWVPYVGPLAIGLFVWPFVVLASILLYYDARVRKEGLTVWELAREMVTSER